MRHRSSPGPMFPWSWWPRAVSASIFWCDRARSSDDNRHKAINVENQPTTGYDNIEFVSSWCVKYILYIPVINLALAGDVGES